MTNYFGIRSRSLVGILGLALATLGAVPLQAQDPVTDGAPTATTEGEGRRLSLDEALRIAEGESEEVAAARAGVTRARGELMRARSQFFPQLYGSASYTRTLKSEFESVTGDDASATPPPPPCPAFAPNPALPVADRLDSLERALVCEQNADPFADFDDLPFGQPNQWRLGLTASQTLFAGGRIIAQNRAAKAGRRAADVALASARSQLLLDVTQAYYDAALSDRLLDIARATYTQAETTFRETQLARQVGTQPEFELLRAQVTRDNLRPVVIQRRSERDIAYLRLKQVLNLPLDEQVTLTTDLGDAEEGTVPRLTAAGATVSDTAAAERAPVRAASENVTTQEALLRAARAQRIPEISLTSTYGRVAYPAGGLPDWGQYRSNWTVGVNLQVPLFTGGSIRGEQMVAEAALEEARARLQQTRELAALDSRNALAQLQAAEASWLASAGTVNQASRAYQIAEIRYREGISTQTELSDSRILLQQAQANRAQAARDLQVARTRLALLRDLPLSTTGASAGVGTQGLTPGLEAQPSPQVVPPREPPQQSTGDFIQASQAGVQP